jgi:hypothetical protein
MACYVINRGSIILAEACVTDVIIQLKLYL